MGYALARALTRLDHQVILVSGPTALDLPDRVDFLPVETAQQMFDAVAHVIGSCDIAIFCAAVADYRVETIAPQKIKKHADTLTLHLVKNPDILGSARNIMGFTGYLVGFAAETENLEANARTKLVQKSCDMVIANDVSQEGIGFDSADNQVWLIEPEENTALPLDSKEHLAHHLAAIITQRASQKFSTRE